MVVLALAMVPSPTAKALARKLNIICDQHGFMTEAHSSRWIRGAASRILSLFSRKELLHECE